MMRGESAYIRGKVPPRLQRKSSFEGKKKSNVDLVLEKRRPVLEGTVIFSRPGGGRGQRFTFAEEKESYEGKQKRLFDISLTK